MKKTIFTACLMLLTNLAVGAESPRIVSADGSLTEIIYALGQGELLVGVDTTSGFPEVAKSLPQIGYKRNISAEGVLSLTPHILIATEDSGPDKILRQIEAAGVNLERYSATPSLLSVREKVLAVAHLVDRKEQGEALWQQIEQDVAIAREELAKVKQKVNVLFVLSLEGGSPVVAGENTHAAEMIHLAGGENAAKGFSGYKAMPLEAIISAQPDVVLMMDRVGNHGVSSTILDAHGFNLTPAGQNQRLVTMDGMLMLGFGPRIAQAIRGLSVAFYPHQLEMKTP